MVFKQLHESKVRSDVEKARIIHRQDGDRQLFSVLVALGEDNQLTPSRYFAIMNTIYSGGVLDEQKSIKHLLVERSGV